MRYNTIIRENKDNSPIYVMTWDGIVTKTDKHYLKELGMSGKIEAYMQSLVIRKTPESISLDRRLDGESIQGEPSEIKETPFEEQRV